MRNAFAEEITELAAHDDRIVLLSGDIGNRLFDNFKAAHPQRFFNCGVAEQNMVTMAAGMAMQGLRPVVYTIASFLIYRPFEQIRVDLAYHHLPVTLVGVGGGLSYAANGGTHHALEDMAVMRSLPGMTVLATGDAYEVRAAVRAIPQLEGPAYFRLGKKNEPLVHEQIPQNFKIGQALQLRKGADLAMVVAGNLLPYAMDVAAGLNARGVSAAVYSMHTIKPVDTEVLNTLFQDYKAIFSIEEHSIVGGLGSAILEYCHAAGHDTRKLYRIGTPDQFIHETADQAHARVLTGLDKNAMQHTVLEQIKRMNYTHQTNPNPPLKAKPHA